MYKHHIYKKNNLNKKYDNDFPGTESYFKNTISFPLYYKMKTLDFKKIINTIRKAIHSKSINLSAIKSN